MRSGPGAGQAGQSGKGGALPPAVGEGQAADGKDHGEEYKDLEEPGLLAGFECLRVGPVLAVRWQGAAVARA